MRAWPSVLLVAATVGCSEPAVPGRPIFSYADTSGGRAVVFHWPAAALPVRYFAQSAGTLPDVVRRHLAIWEAQFLYGEWRAVLVSSAAQADVIVEFSGSPPAPGEPDTASVVPACEGLTTATFTAGGDTVERPLHVGLVWYGGYTTGEVWACVERVVAHELGHTLGLFNQAHAGTNPADLMYGEPQVYLPGLRDRATAEVLYHTPTTVELMPR